jgi:uncharacterized membrane protein YozB (DUF420 family)
MLVPLRQNVLFPTVFAVSILAIIFDVSLTSPIHELGHLLACLALGVRVVSVGWNQILFASVSDWRQNIIGFSGGLLAVLFLFCLYVSLRSGLSHLHPKTKIGILRVNYFYLLIKSVFLADIMVEFLGATLEGANFSAYESIIQNIPVLYAIVLLFSAVSLLIVIRFNKIRTQQSCMHA